MSHKSKTHLKKREIKHHIVEVNEMIEKNLNKMNSEIKLVTLTLQDRTKRKPVTYTLERVIWIERPKMMLLLSNIRDRRIINKTGAKNDLHVVKVDVIKVVGKSNVY